MWIFSNAACDWFYANAVQLLFIHLKHLRSPLFPSHNENVVFLYASLIWCVRRKNTCSPVVMAEWLRRWTRNPMGYSLTGSNPVHDEILSFFISYAIYFSYCKNNCWYLNLIINSCFSHISMIYNKNQKYVYNDVFCLIIS